jgi:cyanophycin synthetase
MKIVAKHLLRGPNVYSRRPCYLVVLDLEDLDEVSSARIPGFVERLCALLPTLHEHRCSPRRPGGFVERLHDGTYMAHIAEHVAIELQCLAGTPVGFGRARSVRDQARHFRVVCAYKVEQVVTRAMEIAVDLVETLARGKEFDLQSPLAALRAIAEQHAVGTSTRAVIDAAARRGIPVTRVTEEANLFQLGWGSRQKRLLATVTEDTGHIAVRIAADKHLTKVLLAEANLPVPRGEVVSSAEEAVRAARRLRAPAAIKPLNGNHGKGVTVDVRGQTEVTAAFETARRHSRQVIVETFVRGEDHRILVAGGKVVAAARRQAPRVTGDGVKTIRELVEIENLDPARGEGHANILTKIALDEHARAVLSKQGLDFDSVLPAGQLAILRGNANLSTGGTAEDVTDRVHPETRHICVRATQKIGLDVAGIDLVCDDISKPLQEQGGAIIELNAAPGIRMHQYPSRGQPQDAGAAIAESMFPMGDRGRIPVLAVTGTNGKTTTTLLISHALGLSGLTVGTTTTEGIFVKGRMISKGDCTGYWSARTVLGSPDVDAAVLETARGGILKRGLAFDRCDVAVVLNVSSDHIGLDGVETVADMARVKGVVARCATRAAVLNAEDPHCAAMARRLLRGCEPFFFSMNPDHPVLLQHLDRGGRATYLESGQLILARGGERRVLLESATMPMAMNGHARHNVANALAAAAALTAFGHPPEAIVAALQSFTCDAKQNPLRCNAFDVHGVKVIVDYAHNKVACEALTTMTRSMLGPDARAVGVVTAPGDRRAADLFEIGKVYGGGFDELIVFDSNPRGRNKGETPALILEGARSSAAGRGLHDESDVRDALALGLSLCRPGDVLVYTCPDTIEHLVDAVRRTDPACADRIAREATVEYRAP